MSEGPYLPAGFTFTQTALRSYRQCPYHFRLRYLENVPWPALPLDSEAEAAMEQGRRFHELARQRFLGLSVQEQVAGADERIARWWAALQTSPPDLEGYPEHYPEAGLSIPLGRYRLAARYDLLAVGDERALVIDWKTGRDLPPASVLAGDLQSRVYRYVLAVGGADYHRGRPLPPAGISLLYWHPEGPQEVRLSYSPAQRDEDGALLTALAAEIAAQPPGALRPTDDEATCAHCPYGPLCGQAGEGGWLEEIWEEEEPPWPEIDLQPEGG